MAEDDSTAKTFTQAEVDAIVRDRLKREREQTAAKYADYDELKAAAASAGKDKSQLDKIEAQLADMTKQAATSARDLLVREVADELKIPLRQAKRLTGGTKQELLDDGREFLTDFAPKGATDDGGKDGAGDDDKNTGAAQQTPPPAAAPRGRPREALRSGAPVTPAAPEETNPLKLAAAIPRY
jgi:hypothetical protein